MYIYNIIYISKVKIFQKLKKIGMYILSIIIYTVYSDNFEIYIY